MPRTDRNPNPVNQVDQWNHDRDLMSRGVARHMTSYKGDRHASALSWWITLATLLGGIAVCLAWAVLGGFGA